MLGVHVETIDWAEDSEVESIASAHAGVMPLADSLWERGKCGYKLIQYMACSLPVVASPIGVNTEIVQEGINGFLAHDASTWVNTLEQLLTQPELATKMGHAGRKRVESEYCLQVTAPKLEKLMRQVVTQSRTTIGNVQ
jgi:glycosyltransferase involved in cell wall biosynthesis